MPIFGWDASDFDWGRGPMDLAAAVRDGMTFFTHKATEGTTITHGHYRDALNRAAAAGMPFMGAYIVVRTPGNNGHGAVPAQVSYFLSYLDSQTPWWRTRPEFFIQVDTEHWGYDDVGPQHGAEACALLRARTGKWVVHYAPRWAYGDTIPGNDPLWASSYGTNPALPYRQAYPGDNSSAWAPYSGRTPIFLQYGSRTTIDSQPGCDANAYRGTVDQLRTVITGGDMDPQTERALKVAFAAPYEQDPAAISPGCWVSKAVEQPLRDALNTVRQVNTKVDALQPGTPTQAQIDAAVLKAMKDPVVLKGIGDAIASHLHVT
jgi:hypothetical protein